MNICARGAQVYIEGQLRTRSWEDNGITRYVTEILVKTTGTMQMLGRARTVRTLSREEARSLSRMVSLSRNRLTRTEKKVSAKTKGRGRKAAQPEPQPQPPDPEDYGFSMTISRSNGLTVTTAPSCAGHHRRSEDERIFQNISGAA